MRSLRSARAVLFAFVPAAVIAIFIAAWWARRPTSPAARQPDPVLEQESKAPERVAPGERSGESAPTPRDGPEMTGPGRFDFGDRRAQPRLDLARVRELVRAGDAAALQSIDGRTEPEDARTLYDMLFEIASGISPHTRVAITQRLTYWLARTPGLETTRCFHRIARNPGLVSMNDQATAFGAILRYRHPEAIPLVERYAFAPCAQTNPAAQALMTVYPDRYIPRIAQGLLNPVSTADRYYIFAFRDLSRGQQPDIGPAIPALQEKLRVTEGNASFPGWFRWPIIETLETYATQHKSEPFKEWLVSELTRLIHAGEGRPDTREIQICRETLARLDPPAKAADR